MTNQGAPTSEFIPPQSSAPEQRWDVLRPQAQEPSTELEPVTPLRTDPTTTYETFGIVSNKNLDRIRAALPEFAQTNTHSLSSTEGSTLYMSRTYGKTYIGRLSADDASVVEGARHSVATYRAPVYPELKEIGGVAIFTALTSAAGALVGGVIQNGKAIVDTFMRGEWWNRDHGETDFANIGATIGTAPGVIYAGVLGYNAISRAVNRAKANTKALVADLHDITGRAEKQFVTLNDAPHTVQFNPDATMEIKAGYFVEDFLKDLSPEAVDYVWNNGLFVVLKDVQAKQTELKDFEAKASSFKVRDTAAQGIAAKMKEERTTALDDSLRRLIMFRKEMLPEVVRLSLEQGEQQDLR